jgi:essential nuclear protein 1
MLLLSHALGPTTFEQDPISKMPEIQSSSTPTRAESRRHKPLADDLLPTTHLRTKPTTSTSGKRKSRSFEENGDGYIDALSSRKILAIAQDLVDEDAAERDKVRVTVVPNAAYGHDSRTRVDVASDEQNRQECQFENVGGDWMPDEDVEDDDVNPADLAVYNKFLPQVDELAGFAPSLAALSTNGQIEAQDPGDMKGVQENMQQTTNLADLILQRIAEKEARDQRKANFQTNADGNARPCPTEIPPKVLDVFTKCGELLSRYKSGPLPKPFKILPTLPSWSDLLSITRPESWTSNAVFAATRIFISAPPDVAQHYLNTVLLDRVKGDIYETKKLNVHLYNALKKALYKPAAFFKGFLFPLVVEGCTLREANIISSVLVRVSIPVLHSAAALLRLCEIAAEQSSSVSTESAGACNIFIRVLLEKKYALPFKAVDALVFHFLRFRNSKPTIGDGDAEMSGARNDLTQAVFKDDKLPVLWHQCLLVFAQRYKNDITEDQREALLDLLLVRGHKDIGPEVRRELLVGRGRGAVQGPGEGGLDGEARAGDGGDDTMTGIRIGSP